MRCGARLIGRIAVFVAVILLNREGSPQNRPGTFLPPSVFWSNLASGRFVCNRLMSPPSPSRAINTRESGPSNELIVTDHVFFGSQYEITVVSLRLGRDLMENAGCVMCAGLLEMLLHPGQTHSSGMST